MTVSGLVVIPVQHLIGWEEVLVLLLLMLPTLLIPPLVTSDGEAPADRTVDVAVVSKPVRTCM
jgi:hypothetical protein